MRSAAVWFEETSSLAALYAASPGYPLRGQLRVAEAPFERGTPTRELPGAGQVWVDARRVNLTFVEFELLYNLARNEGKVLARSRFATGRPCRPPDPRTETAARKPWPGNP